MHTANIATAKNELSRLLRRIKRGESVVITERSHPIARLVPFRASAAAASSPRELAALHEAGVLTPPAASSLDVAAFLAQPAGSLPPDRSLTSALLTEREESR